MLADQETINEMKKAIEDLVTTELNILFETMNENPDLNKLNQMQEHAAHCMQKVEALGLSLNGEVH